MCAYILTLKLMFVLDYMHVILLFIIHGKMYELNCPYSIHYICGMTLTCNGASHCICMGTSHFMRVSAWLKSNTTLVIDEWAR